MTTQQLLDLKYLCDIVHVKSGRVYAWLGFQKIKIDGQWLDSAAYQCKKSCAVYSRLIDNFEGFEKVNF